VPGHIYHAHVEDLPRESRFQGTYERTGVIMDQALLSFVWLQPEARGDSAGQLSRGTHAHNFDQLMYVISGNRTFVIDGVDYRCGPGDVVYIPANVPHGGKSEPGDVASHVVEVFAPMRTDYLYICEHQTTLAAPLRDADGSRKDLRTAQETVRATRDTVRFDPPSAS
jgi:mannose-6-phosphate isomerase-like protein (cupin superfamily)